MYYERLWTCSDDISVDEPCSCAGNGTWVCYDTLADIGTPLCPGCDFTMELVDGNDNPAAPVHRVCVVNKKTNEEEFYHILQDDDGVPYFKKCEPMPDEKKVVEVATGIPAF